MNRNLSAPLVALALATCGAHQGPPSESAAPVATVSQATEDPAPPGPTPEGEARAELLARIQAHREMDPDQWSPEMVQALYPGGVDALVGATRDELLAALGAPNAGPEFGGADRLAWQIGIQVESRRSFPPVLVVVFDEAGIANSAFWHLSM